MNKAAFYKWLRRPDKFGALTQSQVDGIERILDLTDDLGLAWRAYILATAWHETGTRMQPVREAPNASEDWRRRNFRYYPYYGRGLVQITHKQNYEWLDAEMAKRGLTKPGEILNDLDLALRPDISALALVVGMIRGRYDSNGKTMADRLPKKGVATREQYIQARRLVNILDKADLIEDYAQVFEKALREGGQTE